MGKRKQAASKADKGGGLLRLAERTGVNRGLLGGSKNWFYVGTGLWTLRKVRSMAERKTEILLSETLAPGDRLVIANGRATIDRAQASASASDEAAAASRRRRRKAEKARKRDKG